MFRHKVEKITPEIAKIYYSRSTGNRVINRQAVKAIVAKCEAINEKKILHSRNNAQYTSKSNAELLGIYRGLRND